MFRHRGFVESWSANAAAEVLAAKGRPRALLDACGAPIRWGLRSAVTLDAKETGGGQEFALSTSARVLVQNSRQCELITRLPKELVPPCDGTKTTLILDDVKALEAFRIENGKVWVPFDLELPPGSQMLFQPPLTSKELDGEGPIGPSYRPPLVIGSFAIYGPSDGGTGHYDFGKLGHLYRPFLIDLAGEWTWCDWFLEAGKLWALLPLPWLQSMTRKWPVVLDPTFGHDSSGGTGTSFDKDLLWYMIAETTPASNGTTDSMEFYTTTAADTFRLALYNNTAEPNSARLGQTAEITSSLNAWSGGAMAGVAVTTGTTYRLALWIGTNLGTLYDAAGSKQWFYRELTYHATNDFPNPWGTSANGYNLWTALRVTYTAAGGTIIPQIMSSLRHRWG